MNIDVNNTDIRITDNTDITANDEAELSAGLGYSLLSLNLPVLFWALVLNRYIYILMHTYIYIYTYIYEHL
jgi:hypothetical protein